MKSEAVTIRNVSISFGNTRVIDDLTFSVKHGETFGLLGSNGSGKTTIIRALLGIYRVDDGKMLIDGQPYQVSNGIRLGYLPEERGLYKKEKVIDIMMYFGQLKGLTRNQACQESLAFLDRVQLTDKATTRLDKLSGGQQQKIQLGVTVLGDPELLILDEPTKGFDPVNRRLLMKIIEEYQTRGATVIFVTHQMEEVERLCDRIILLKDGKAAAYGTVASVRKQHGGSSLDNIFVSIYGGEETDDA
ncbi:MAG: ATP-binding cassette domain-containing protein [Candidatus Saccharimonadales bacterium]